MSTLSRQDYIDALQNGWGSYVSHFRRLSSIQQEAFLKKQGYASLRDLLAHVIAWWQLGLTNLPQMINDPSCENPDIDDDDFNAKAVARFQPVDEAEVIRIFDQLRTDYASFITRLSDTTLNDPRISGRLYMELIGHLAEHAFDD
jgi:hypothetical protein